MYACEIYVNAILLMCCLLNNVAVGSMASLKFCIHHSNFN